MHSQNICVVVSESLRILRSLPNVLDGVPPIISLFTDGGNDHGARHASVQFALLAQWLTVDADAGVGLPPPRAFLRLPALFSTILSNRDQMGS